MRALSQDSCTFEHTSQIFGCSTHFNGHIFGPCMLVSCMSLKNHVLFLMGIYRRNFATAIPRVHATHMPVQNFRFSVEVPYYGRGNEPKSLSHRICNLEACSGPVRATGSGGIARTVLLPDQGVSRLQQYVTTNVAVSWKGSASELSLFAAGFLNASMHGRI